MGSSRRDRLRSARLYLVCDAVSIELADAALRGGVDLLQLRMKAAGNAEVLRAAERLRPICEARGALFILNDRPDLAVEAGADGVHVGQEDVPVARAREAVGPDLLIGLSTHTPAQIDASAHAGVDYIGVGPVHQTPTKPGRPAVGVELVAYAAAAATVPFFAIGGVTAANIGALTTAGASRVAVVRAITQADDPERAARALRAALRGGVAVGAAQP